MTMFSAMTLKVPSPRPSFEMVWQMKSKTAQPASSCTKSAAASANGVPGCTARTCRTIRNVWNTAKAMEAVSRESSSRAWPQSSTSCWKGLYIIMKKNTARPPLTLGTVPSVNRFPTCPSHRGPKMSNVLNCRAPEPAAIRASVGSWTV